MKYIVEQTVGPVLHAAVQGAKDDAARVRAVLSVNVLDPAMGSGHFLVEAADAIARFLVDLGMPAEDDAHGEADLAYWRRRAAQSCVYGVDLNPLAVELAKLSLWLATAARDRPLSFLDHHLRTGNSLVGARLNDLQPSSRLPKKGSKPAKKSEVFQLSLLSDDAFRRNMSTAIDLMWLIERTAGITVDEVKAQERSYEELRANLTRRYGVLADLVTATHFGLSFDMTNPSLWTSIDDYVRLSGNTLHPKEVPALLEAAEAIAAHHRFFHWELEFPEVFFDRHGRPLGEQAGFDAVIGNPPYIRQERLASFKPYFEATFASFHGVADLYLYFYEQGLRSIRHGGRLAYISSGTFARANFALAFRKALPAMGQIESLIDFGENQPFEGAEMVRPTIVVLEKRQQEAPFRSLFIADKVPQSLEQTLVENGIDCDPAALQQPEWTFQAATSTHLFTKLQVVGRPLLDAVDGRMYRGIITGLTEAFIVDQATRDRLVEADPSCAALLKPWLRGEDLRPWYQEREGQWLISLPCGWTRSAFGANLEEQDAWQRLAAHHPAIAEHLERYADAARQRGDKGEQWWELRPCDYYPAFTTPKILWPDISKLPRFSWDDAGTYVGNTAYFIPDAAPWLLGLLQTRALWFAVSQVCQPLRLRAGLWQYRMFTQFVGRLPIPALSSADETYLGNLALTLTEQARARYDLHRKARNRILGDLGTPGRGLNQKLTAWWTLDLPAFRAEVQKVFKRDILLKERDDWEAWLIDRRALHEAHTAEIVRLETALNARVYALFDLTPAEIQLVEESTRYRYGEV